ncbi:hypothetical protein ACFYUD_24950 [Nocardia tengchongensis]|uniref:Uncharacterized protein n=1 Tax=Nocardia tengchongensis TaxID=2055889 RepID=A0ABX8CS59_9NOCA|nr:hypothetical protein [Nocardia tengchongensis]QVI22156.1 hypothetical protein KHQ06_03210 [Nocardia tengchongensis]
MTAVLPCCMLAPSRRRTFPSMTEMTGSVFTGSGPRTAEREKNISDLP